MSCPTPSYLHFPVVTNDAGQKLSKQTLAPAIGTTDACTMLRDALCHLGQPLPDLVPATPSAWLLAATRRWNADAIPKRRTLGNG